MYSNNVSRYLGDTKGRRWLHTWQLDDEEMHRNEQGIGNLKLSGWLQLSPTVRTMMPNDYNAGLPALGQVLEGWWR